MRTKTRLAMLLCICVMFSVVWGISFAVSSAAATGSGQLTPQEDDPGYQRLSGLIQPAAEESVSGGEESVSDKDIFAGEGSFLAKISPILSGLKGLSSSTSSYTGKTYTHASDFDSMNIYNGIDISYHQGTVDFDKIKADGIDFVILRLGYRGYSSGTLVTDSKFTTYIKGAIDAGLPIGVYFWTEAIDTEEAQEEAEYVISQLEPYKASITMPVAIDWELNSNSRHSGLSKDVNTAICTTFCDTVAASGYTPMIYANISDLNNNLSGQSLSEQYEIWVARYNNIVSNSTTHYYGTYSMWQYASDGAVDGISGNVDMNFWYTSGSPSAPVFTHSATAVAGGTAGTTATTGTTAAAVTTTTPPLVEDLEELDDMTGLSAVSASKSITLSWSQVKDADGYEIYRKDTYDGSFTKINTIANGETLFWKDTTVAQKHEYYYKVRAYHNNSEGKIYSSYSTVTEATKASSKVGVTKASVILYKKPKAQAKKLITLKKGNPLEYVGVTYLSDGSTYHHFRYYAGSTVYDGYRTAKSSVTYYTKGTTTATKLNIRKTAGVSGKLLASIPKGTALPLLGTKKVKGATWYKTCYATKKNKIVTGYVAGNYVKK
jgi:GH25 family lysozyme M1 (1,4-beta-N-acetylmuramidase)